MYQILTKESEPFNQWTYIALAVLLGAKGWIEDKLILLNVCNNERSEGER